MGRARGSVKWELLPREGHTHQCPLDQIVAGGSESNGAELYRCSCEREL